MFHQVASAVQTKAPDAAETSIPLITTKHAALRDLWTRVLDIDPRKVFPGDSFFDCGGDALAAVRLVSIARRYGWQLTLAQVFQNGTLDTMANAMQPYRGSAEQDGATEPQA
jgi:fusarinine C synthase